MRPRWAGRILFIALFAIYLCIGAAQTSAHTVENATDCWVTSARGHFESYSSTVYVSLTGPYLVAWNRSKAWWQQAKLTPWWQSGNTIYTVQAPSATWYGATYKSNFNDAGDATSWSIELNISKMNRLTTQQKAYVIAHELGHVWGLGDVSTKACAGKALMYGEYAYVGAAQHPDTSGFAYIWQ